MYWIRLSVRRNKGKNEELMKVCTSLREYSECIEAVREEKRKGRIYAWFWYFDTEDYLKDSDEYCYSFDSYDAKGVCYSMHAMKDTKKINSSFLYHHITFAVTWIKKE